MKYLLLLVLTLAAPASLAQVVAPDALLRTAAVDVIDKVKQDQARQATDPARVAALIDPRSCPCSISPI